MKWLIYDVNNIKGCIFMSIYKWVFKCCIWGIDVKVMCCGISFIFIYELL